MEFSQPLKGGTLVRRYKRFFADVMSEDGEAITAHCPNPGSMMGLAEPGSPVWISRSDSKTRKLAHTLEMVEARGAKVGVNTVLANRIAAEAIEGGRIAELAGYDSVRREVNYGEASRVDFLLEGEGRAPCFVEVKSVTLSRKAGLAEFPDSVSARALKHLDDLAREAAAGARSVLLFLVQRDDCQAFDAAHDIDPAYGARLMEARKQGVEVLCYGCHLSERGIALNEAIAWRPRI